MKRLVILLALLCLPLYAATTYVTVTLTVANSDGTLPSVTPEAYATVTWMPVASPAVIGLSQKATYDPATGTLSWTLPASSQVKFRVPLVPGVGGTYTLPASGTYDLNTAAPVTPAASPGWASSISPFLTIPAKGSIAVSNGTAWAMLAPGTNDYRLTADSTQPSGVKWAAVALSSTVPGGSSGQLQFNNAGAFGGVPGTSVNGSTGAMTLTAQAATTTPLTLQGTAGQSAPVLSIVEASNARGFSLTNPTGTTSITMGGYTPGLTMTCYGRSGMLEVYPDITLRSGATNAALVLSSIYSATTRPAIIISQNYDPKGLVSSGLFTALGLNTQFSFAPSSGSLSVDFAKIGGTWNQTGTASGNWRALVVNPTITASLGTANYLAWFGTSDTVKACITDTGAMTLASAMTAAAVTYSTLPPIYANNAAAVAGGLVAGQTYRTGADPDVLCVVH